MDAANLISPSNEEQRELLQFSRDTLKAVDSAAQAKVLDAFAGYSNSSALLAHQPCFVTLKQKNGRLRGCIGTMQTGNSLYKNVHYFTLQAAQSDPRFPPVQLSEIDDLRIEISVLGPMRPLPTIEDLKLGREGLFVRRGQRRGVLLAKVAVEQKWDREEFLRQTCQKAGLDPDLEPPDEIYCFEEFAFGDAEMQA